MTTFTWTYTNEPGIFYGVNLINCYDLVAGGDALVSSGIVESLLQVLDWKACEPMNITVSPVD